MVRLKKIKVVQKVWNVLDLTEAESIHYLVIQNCDITISQLQYNSFVRKKMKKSITRDYVMFEGSIVKWYEMFYVVKGFQK